MKAFWPSLLALSLVTCLPTTRVVIFRGGYGGPNLLEQHSSFETFSHSVQRTMEHKAIITITPALVLPKTSTRQISDKQFSPREDKAMVRSEIRRPDTSGTSSSLEERSLAMNHIPLHLEAYGRVHDYALVCAGNRADTQYCQGEFLRYSCNSYGALVQRQGGYQSETCDSMCVCVNLAPKPFCISGYLGTTTCL